MCNVLSLPGGTRSAETLLNIRVVLYATKTCTTRSENEACCFMGLFEIDIPTIYGEGGRGLSHLYAEVIAHSPAHSHGKEHTLQNA